MTDDRGPFKIRSLWQCAGTYWLVVSPLGDVVWDSGPDSASGRVDAQAEAARRNGLLATSASSSPSATTPDEPASSLASSKGHPTP